MSCHDKGKVTIIIPAYNAEGTIRACLRSLQKQTYTNLQIIVIDDGSTDGTLEACREFAEKDPRMTIISQENKGVSHARNRGIIEATGTFIQFVDADDELIEDMTEQLINQCTDMTDLVICGYFIKEEQAKTAIVPTASGTFSLIHFLAQSGELFAEHLLQSPCNKLYRRSVVKTNSLRFPEALNLGEDLSFNISYIENCRIINILNKPLYIYISRDESLSQQVNDNYFFEQKELINHMKELLQKYAMYNTENEQALHDVFSQVIINVLSQSFKKHAGSKHHILKELALFFKEKEIIAHLPHFNKNRQAIFIKHLISYDLKRVTYLFLKGKSILSKHKRLYNFLKMRMTKRKKR